VIPECLTSEPPLLQTDEPDHRSACHRWETVAAEPDVTMLFHNAFAADEARSIAAAAGPTAATDGATAEGEA
jgi:hypothetical protein